MISEPTPENIAHAGSAIREGKLIVMPTETVYGLACDATNPAAIGKVFEAKGRPSDHPIIVHLGDVSWIERVAIVDTRIPLLAKHYWPGPLTVVLKRLSSIPSVVSGGLDTVAVRVPMHPVALALLRECDLPLAAPSANRFGRLSPTRAEDVDPEIAASAEMLLQGGPCQVGIESTVLDLSSEVPRLLRPGGVPRAEIEALLGASLAAPEPGAPKSPGTHPVHYAPITPVRLAARLEPNEAGLVFDAPKSERQIPMPTDAEGYAAELYAALKRLDALKFDEIVVQLPPGGPAWEAVRDRLRRASATSR